MELTTISVAKDHRRRAVGTLTASDSSGQCSEEAVDSRTRCVPPAYKVFQIPELADYIAQYLRPIYMSQLRLVCKAFYTAYIPYLRFHLHRNSTASWTSFPLLQHGCKEHSLTTFRRLNRSMGMEPLPIEMSGTDEDHDFQEPKQLNHLLGTQTTTPLWKGLGIGRSYGDLVHTITADSMDNFNALVPILSQCPNLHTLSVTRWHRDVHIFREAFPSRLQNLTVSFYNTVDLNVFLGTLTSSSGGRASKDILIEGLARMTPASGEGKQQQSPQGLGSLRSLDIKNRVPDTNFIRWKVFKNTLDRLPSLQHLALTGIGFLGGKDHMESSAATGQDINADPANNVNPSTFIFGNGSSNMGVGAHFTGILDDEDDEEDEEDEEDEDLTRSFELGNGDSIRSYPNLQSLALSFCYCPVTIMLDLDRIFPKLTSLEVNKCRNTWLHVFEPDPLNPTSHLDLDLEVPATLSSSAPSLTSTTAATAATAAATTTLSSSPPSSTTAVTAMTTMTMGATNGTVPQYIPVRRVPFPDLTHLKLVEQYEGNEDLIHEIVKARPGLLSLETHQISLNVNTLLPMATFCSENGRFFNRFSLSYCWSNPQTRRDYERLFEAPFLSRAKHLYIQQEITKKMHFASTLTSLHIGAGFSKQSAIENDSLPVWNEILRSLPKLEILRIDRYIKDYLLFEGLGRAVPTTPAVSGGRLNSNGSSKKSTRGSSPSGTTADRGQEETESIEDWTQERPFLRELHITFRPACIVKTADLDRELIQRFRFLERLCFSCIMKPDDLADYKARWRPGLMVEHCRNEMRKHGYIE